MTTFDLPQGVTENTIAMLFGHPDPTMLLTAELREAMQTVISSPHGYAALQYGPEQGTRALIEVLAEKIRREQGLPVQSGNVMITAGSTGALDMLTRLYAKPGGVVLIEAPSYADSIHTLRDQQVELYSVPIDDDGLITSALEAQLVQLQASGKAPRMLYTIPNFHNPAGITLSEARRREIIQLSERYGFLVVEDDVYRDLTFDKPAPPSLYALADGQRVVSIGSFSKTLAPGLRLGWIVAAEEIVQRCVNCGTSQMGGGVNPFTAQMVAEYFHRGGWDKHLAQLRTLYKTRRDVVVAALAEYMPADVQWTHPGGGFFIWLTLPQNVFAGDVKRVALEEGVTLASGAGFFLDPADGEHNIRLAYSCATHDDIARGIEILARVIDRVRRS